MINLASGHPVLLDELQAAACVRRHEQRLGPDRLAGPIRHATGTRED
jgi:hypothetical protein